MLNLSLVCVIVQYRYLIKERRHLMKRIFLPLFLILGTFSASFAASNATDVYLLAQTKSTSELQKVENIDVVDSDGNTALCSAIKDNNIDAYNLLKKAGANTEHKCVKKIPAKQYQAFTQKLAATNKSWSFLGMGKWAWTAIGAGVVAGAAAAAMGGGGGSSGGGESDVNPLSYYTPRFNEWLQQGFQYEPCQDGYYATDSVYDWAGIPGDSEKIWMYKCAPNYCSYTTTECTDGYVETGETCQSGETLYKRCVPQTCPNNYMISCPSSGFHETGNTCQHGNYTLKECEPNTCEGYDYTDSNPCPDGYTISASCLSGWTTKYKCDTPATCLYDTTECTGGYVETGNTCQSGEILYKECAQIQCGVNANWTEDGCVCNTGYQNWQSGVGCSLTPIDCGANASQQGTQCVCDSGYTEWTQGVGCYAELDCGINATQQGNQCVCDSGYNQWTPGYGCYQQKYCGSGATQQGNQCVCNPGYTQWTQGVGCYAELNCGENATQQGNKCVCNSGYTQWTQGVGCYAKLNCGANATQQGANCQCNNGYQNWTQGIGCYPVDCGVNATQQGTQCVCNSGYTQWALGYGCYPVLDCGNHAHQNGGSCVCDPGYSNWLEGIGCFTLGNTSQNYPNNVYLNVSSPSGNTIGKQELPWNVYNNNTGTGTTGATGIVSINKTGNGNIYGLKYPSNGPYNVIDYLGGAKGYVNINNSGNGNIYGLYSDTSGSSNISAEYSNTAQSSPSVAVIDIQNSNNTSSVYGMYASNITNSSSYLTNVNVYNNKFNETIGGKIHVINYGSGNVYGLCSQNQSKAINAFLQIFSTGSSSIVPHITGKIDIENFGNADVYGMYNGIYNSSVSTPINIENPDLLANITITNHGSGNSYGMYNGHDTDMSNASGGTGIINMFNRGNGNAYGMYNTTNNTWHTMANASNVNYTNSTGKINIYNYSDGQVFGMYGNRVNNANYTSATSEINIQNVSSGEAIGLYSTGSVSNSGAININNIGSGTAIGIFGDTNSSIYNTGTINITRDTYVDSDSVYHPSSELSDNVFGIYAKSGSTVNNSGTINITTNNIDNAYGIYVESGSTVTNTGTISINGNTCSGSDCNTGNYIVLNGSTLYNSGVVAAPQMNLNSMGGNIVAGLGSQFVVDNELSGNLNISSDIVQSGNQTTYIAENMIDAGDVSGLNIRSASAMFNASLADNGHDVVMQMKDFNELTDNASLAAFLKNNYTNGNGSELFSTLKSMDNMSAFNSTLSGLTGLNTFTQFAHEDLSAMREISFSMNNKLFENSGRDSFDISDSTGYFSFSNDHNGGNGQYGISSDKISDNWKLGYGMAMANINTGDGDSMHRQNNLWLFYMPATYTNDDIELVIAPKAGFAHSEYNRRGYNNMNYEGYIEKRIFGLMNDLRYPLTFGNWTFAPDLAFNTIVYEQSGREDEQAFSLIIPDDRTVSVETGLGFYTKYEKQLSNGGKFKLNSGLMLYREFGDTYDIKLGMRGMDGTFSLYNNDYEYRGAASLGFDYTAGHLHLYGNAQYFMDNDNYMNFKGGVSYRF